MRQKNGESQYQQGKEDRTIARSSVAPWLLFVLLEVATWNLRIDIHLNCCQLSIVKSQKGGTLVFPLLCPHHRPATVIRSALPTVIVQRTLSALVDTLSKPPTKAFPFTPAIRHYAPLPSHFWIIIFGPFSSIAFINSSTYRLRRITILVLLPNRREGVVSSHASLWLSEKDRTPVKEACSPTRPPSAGGRLGQHQRPPSPISLSDDIAIRERAPTWHKECA